MRALLIWCALGAGLIGLKAHLDRTAAKYPDVAVRAGSETYFIPRQFVRNDGWRADAQRLAGCWDAREAGLVPVAASVTACGERPLDLNIPANLLGLAAAEALRGHPLAATFWPSYAPPTEHLTQAAEAWRGQGAWTNRSVARRSDWQLVQIVSPASPWIYLLTAEPATGDLAKVYAGRCYRPEPLSDVGMTCELVLRIGNRAAIEYALGPDEVMQFSVLRESLLAQASIWRRT